MWDLSDFYLFGVNGHMITAIYVFDALCKRMESLDSFGRRFYPNQLPINASNSIATRGGIIKAWAHPSQTTKSIHSTVQGLIMALISYQGSATEGE